MQKFLESIKKRNGKIVSFDRNKVEEAIFKALKVAGMENRGIVAGVTDRVIHNLKRKFGYDIPSVEEVQDVVEQELIASDLGEAAKAYILYRRQRSELRDSAAGSFSRRPLSAWIHTRAFPSASD